MIPVIIPVISGEEGRGVWSSSRKQRKSLQVDQEEEFQQRCVILGGSTNGVRCKNKGVKVFNPNEKRGKSKDPGSLGVFPGSYSPSVGM